ncbi:hypothetical protein MAPG_05134 [Magnaporthiopsis poae ATCC 64411]|uniref:AB hydrolase-1 domain-containing protein n=1 Tax=Magnaporthiopsis poae (strain ATCC 64411 / 73-15) TaxID=644358 RepID=A0A0C4DYK9_MAGP6|nr:hypothetical protein MAPG_05134 [Magnaporthiopsis poae ATCC 64411]
MLNGRSSFLTSLSVHCRHCMMGIQNPLPLALAPSLDAVLCQPDSASPVHFHLVHGAWHGPWTFDLLRAELEGRGYSTSVSALPSVGTTDPEIGLYDDGAAVRADLERLIDAGKEVVLVVHSYGGLATSNGVEGLSIQQRKAAGKQGGVLSHVFIAAMALDVGTSLSRMLEKDGVPEYISISADGKFGSLLPERVEETFYNGVEDKALVAKGIASLRQMTSKAFEEPSQYAPWNNGFNVGYIFTEKDNAVPLALQQAMFSQFPPGSFNATMDTGHAPVFSKPKELADNLVAAYKHVKPL